MSELLEIRKQLNRIEGRLKMQDSIDNFINLEQLCEFMQINKKTYYSKNKMYGFDKYKISGRLFFDKNEVGRYLRESLTKTE